MKKLYSKWVPRLLTVEQKQQRIHDSERCLKLFTCNKKDFLRRYITMNETWIQHFTPESKRASAEWGGEGESRPKRLKTQQSAGRANTGLCVLGHARNFAHRFSSEGPDDQQRLLHCLIGSIGRRNQEEKASHGKEETAVSARQCTGPQVDENDGEIERSTIRIASIPPIFTRSGPIRFLPVCKSQKDAPG